MADILRVHWTLTPANAPRPLRHCATCGAAKQFISSGKIRLNANGRRLDAWLIYRCAGCDRTWLRTILERVAVQHIPQEELDAMEQSLPAWVRRHEFDTVALGQYAKAVIECDDLLVIKTGTLELDDIPQSIEIALSVAMPAGIRLDRFLSQELSLSRARIKTAHKNGGLLLDPDGHGSLRRKIGADMTIKLCFSAFSGTEFRRICNAVFAREATDCRFR